MSQTKLLANRIREVFLNGTWIANTNYKDQLSKLTMKQALLKKGQLNTIAALTYHVNYYIDGILNFFEGGSLEIKDRFSFDMPKIKSEKDWDRLRNTLFNNAEKFALIIENLPEKRLSEIFVNEKYGTYQRNIEGMLEHGYYHLGQVVLINKITN